MYIPTIAKNGKALMPCKPSKARKLLRNGLAKKCWGKLGIFHIQLNFNPKSRPNKGQKLCLGLDTGSKFDGIAIVSKQKVQQTGMLELPKGIAKKLKMRRQLRRARRFRNKRRRPSRFDNRRRKDGWIAPSQKAKVSFRLKIIEELRNLYPIKLFAVEDVRFNHFKKRWGKFFSTVEIGKTMLYEKLKEWGKLILFSGVDTAHFRTKHRLKKSSRKSERTPNSHAVDAMVLAGHVTKARDYTIPTFYVWKRYQYCRRQLHKANFKKGGVRPREGGTNSLPPFSKGDIATSNGKMARIGGYRNERMSLHAFDLDNRRFTQNANPEEWTRLFNQKIMSQFIPPINRWASLRPIR